MKSKNSTTLKAAEIQNPGVHIVQTARASFRNIVSPVPAVIWVLSGTKRVSTERQRKEVARGFFVLLPENQPITVENIPSAQNPYEARVLALDRGIFEHAYSRLDVRETQRRKPFQTTAFNSDIADAFSRAEQALSIADKIPPSVLHNRCEEVILWLAETGTFLSWALPASMSDRTRAVISQNLEHPWTCAEVGRELAMSEATLRRKLQSEGASFKQVVLDFRLVAALNYVQTTAWRLPAIAKAVGYASTTRFLQRFQERFGLHPNEIRHRPS